MSIEDEENQKKKSNIVVEIDRTREIDDLQEQLTREKVSRENAEETLKLIAEKEFSAQLKKYHLPEGSTPEDLKTAMSLEKKEARGGDTLSWSQNIQEKNEDPRQKTDLSSLLVDNTDEGLRNTIEFLNFKKKSGTQEEKLEAQKLLGKAEKKIFSKSKTLLDLEFEGSLKDLVKREIPINPAWTDEQKAQAEKLNEEIRKKRSNWSQKD